jgi:hypothetical protein
MGFTASLSAWRLIELQGVSRIYRHPRILDKKITLNDYQGSIRQIVINELGREKPIFLPTNKLKRSAPKLIQRYAQRMNIENGIENIIDFFYMDTLPSWESRLVQIKLLREIFCISLIPYKQLLDFCSVR